MAGSRTTRCCISSAICFVDLAERFVLSKSDDAVGVEVAWSWKGFSAKIRSRLVSAADRAGGARLDSTTLDTDREVAIRRAVTDAQFTLITSASKAVSKGIESDPELARRALAVFARADRQAENVGASFSLALDDLRNRPTDEIDSDEGPDEVRPEFLDRWEQYASQATTEQIREKWGRILSAEIPTPNTFSLKLLRVLDEIDAETAELRQYRVLKSDGLRLTRQLNQRAKTRIELTCLDAIRHITSSLYHSSLSSTSLTN